MYRREEAPATASVATKRLASGRHQRPAAVAQQPSSVGIQVANIEGGQHAEMRWHSADEQTCHDRLSIHDINHSFVR